MAAGQALTAKAGDFHHKKASSGFVVSPITPWAPINSPVPPTMAMASWFRFKGDNGEELKHLKIIRLTPRRGGRLAAYFHLDRQA